MIAASRLGFVYRGAGGERPALSGVDFRVAPGECLGVLGGGGAGKSTLASLVAGILSPSAGSLTVGGLVSGGRRRDRERRLAMVGYAFQRPEDQLFALTVAEDVGAGLGADSRREADAMDRVAAALALVGLPPEAGLRKVASLSVCESRLVALAGVLVNDRPVVVLDEPTAGLDAPGRRTVTALLARLKSAGRTLLITSHRPEELLGTADRLLVLGAGRVLFSGTCAEALERAGLPEAGAFRWPPHVELLAALRRGGMPLPAECPPAEIALRVRGVSER
jgi:energy-coupling factor transport system ATP-binding protein